MQEPVVGYANYTVRFVDYVQHELIRQGIDPSQEDSAQYAFPETLRTNMPADSAGVPFWKRLYDRNCVCEIGFETEELFTIWLNIASESCVETFKTRLPLFTELLDAIGRRGLSLERTKTVTADSDTDSYFLNPVDVTPQPKTLSNQEKHDHTYSDKEIYTDIFTGKSNGELLRELSDARAMYEDALAYFDDLFMRIY